jgi:glucan biosynthesis protein
MNFETMLEQFSRAAAAGDAARFTQLFAPDGRYHDSFFGTHQGRAAIAAMLERFSVGGEHFTWQFSDPVSSAQLGYASYRFSYVSKEPESRGQLIVFEGMSRFRLQDDLIAEYAEVFDRGVAFVQLGYEPARINKLLGRYARQWRDSEAAIEHLAWRARCLD